MLLFFHVKPSSGKVVCIQLHWSSWPECWPWQRPNMLLWSQEPALAWYPAIHIPTDPEKRINMCADECMWAPGRAADLLQLMGKLVCLKHTRSVCLVNHVTFLLQAKNSKVKCVDKPGVRAYLRKLSLSPGAICDIKVYCTDSLNKRIHWQGLLEISVRDACHTAGT